MLYPDLVYKIRGTIFEVYKNLGCGFKENIYQNALKEELEKREIEFLREETLTIEYKGKKVGFYRPDFIVGKKVIVELKAVAQMPKCFQVQLFNYLRATNYKLGLLVNFGSEDGVEIVRRIYDKVRKR